MIDKPLTKKEPIQCKEKIYSEEYKREFDIENDIFRVEKYSADSGKLMLIINRIPTGEWFKKQF